MKPENQEGQFANNFHNFVNIGIGIAGRCYRASDTRPGDKKQTVLFIKTRWHKAWSILYRLHTHTHTHTQTQRTAF